MSVKQKYSELSYKLTKQIKKDEIKRMVYISLHQKQLIII